VIDGKMSITDAVAAPRMHHQWMPDEIVVERGFSPDLMRALRARGHVVREEMRWSAVNSIAVTADGLVGAADARTRGALAAGW
jgi:gamma-glutamyltranspeptidase / glutathione hydrolase